MRIAFDNMKYHRSKNMLTGIAIVLTTLLLFLVPTVGVDMILAQYEMVNEEYPTWHAIFSNVDRQSVRDISLHHDIKDWGVIFTKLDETCSLGNIINVKMLTDAPLSYTTSGQNVPNDIEVINEQFIAKQLLGGNS